MLTLYRYYTLLYIYKWLTNFLAIRYTKGGPKFQGRTVLARYFWGDQNFQGIGPILPKNIVRGPSFSAEILVPGPTFPGPKFQ